MKKIVYPLAVLAAIVIGNCSVSAQCYNPCQQDTTCEDTTVCCSVGDNSISVKHKVHKKSRKNGKFQNIEHEVARTFKKGKDGTVTVYNRTKDGTVKVYKKTEGKLVHLYDKTADGTVHAYHKTKNGVEKAFDETKAAFKKATE